MGTNSVEEIRQIHQTFELLSNGIQTMQPQHEFLLGSPLTEQAAVICLDRKIADMERLTNKLINITSHNAYFLLRISITTPRLIFFLRGTPMWKNIGGLKRYDDSLKSSLETILNINLSQLAWHESSLPIKRGGLGINHASEIALPCFLSSIYGVSDLLDQLLSVHHRHIDPAKDETEESWRGVFGYMPPEHLRHMQKMWELFRINNKVALIENSLDKPVEKARFLANSSHEAGSWLTSLPSPQLGTHLENEEFRISVSLRLGLPILQPHVCVCGDKVDQYARHGLSRLYAKGTRPRHESVNNIFLRALKWAEIPCRLEPPGCFR